MSELDRVLAFVDDEGWYTAKQIGEAANLDGGGRAALTMLRALEQRAWRVSKKRNGSTMLYSVAPPPPGVVVRDVGAPVKPKRVGKQAALADGVDLREWASRPARRTLPLYDAPPPVAVLQEPPLARDPSCRRCVLGEREHKTTCVGANGVRGRDPSVGTLLVVGENVGRNEDVSGLPFNGPTGRTFRTEVARWWPGDVVYDHAVRCVPQAADKLDKPVAACRAYGAAAWAMARPARVLCVGPWAALSVMGRKVNALGARKSYAYVRGERDVPVFFLMPPGMAARSRFLRKMLNEDLHWALTTTPPLPPWGGTVTVVRDVSEAEAMVEALITGLEEGARWVTYDVETCGVMWTDSFRMLSASFGLQGSDDAWVVDRDALTDPGVRDVLNSFMVTEALPKTGQNLKYDLTAWLSFMGVMPRGVVMDTRFLRKLLDVEADADLDSMAESVGMGGAKHAAGKEQERAVAAVRRTLMVEHKAAKKGELPPTSLEDIGVPDHLVELVRNPDVEKEKWSYGLIPRDLLHQYNARDVVTTARVAEWVERAVAADADLHRIATKVVNRLAPAVAQVEAWGVYGDVHRMNVLGMMLRDRGELVRGDLNMYGPGVNWASPDQVADLLYRKLRLPCPTVTNTGKPSTAAEALEAIRESHPVVERLLEYRRIEKLLGTYADGLRPHVRQRTGRIHPSINPDGARTGRMSCSDPNLQNQPTEKDDDGGLAKMVRDIFCAQEEDTCIVSLDYSQIELRVAAMLSGDPVMRAIFESGDDFHLRTAQLIAPVMWGIEPDKVTKAQRRAAKSVNFGVLYGLGIPALAAQIGCTHKEAERVHNAVMGKFRVLAAWTKRKRTDSTRSGESRTWWDGHDARRRNLWRIGDVNDKDRSRAENGAVNTPIQGTANEYCSASFVELTEWLVASRFPAKLILPVHDALLFEVKRSHAAELIGKARDVMTSWDSQGVPIVVDAEMGESWGKLEAVKL